MSGKGSYHYRYEAARVDCLDDFATLYSHPNEIVHCILINRQPSGSGGLGEKDEEADSQDSPPFSHLSLHSQAAEMFKM